MLVAVERPGDGVDVAARGGAAGVKGVGDGPAARATGRRQRERRAQVPLVEVTVRVAWSAGPKATGVAAEEVTL